MDAASGSPTRLDPAAAISARQASFKRIGTAFKSVTDQLKTDSPDRSIMVNSAQTMAASARELAGLFPVGSGSVAGPSTKALPEIWTQRSQFDARLTLLVAEAGRLASAASGVNVNQTRAQARILGAVCSECHRQFRARE
ncbi:c-type cytochrome [Sphingobium sp.]|uniref:c-type cytochrome n=1 Tax=Sphingobium sp. TaxID=1912891 RepID=UPI0039C93F56